MMRILLLLALMAAVAADSTFPVEKCFRAGSCKKIMLRPLLSKAEQDYFYDTTDLDLTFDTVAGTLKCIKDWLTLWRSHVKKNEKYLATVDGGLVVGKKAYSLVEGPIKDGAYRAACQKLHGTVVALESPEHLAGIRFLLWKSGIVETAVDMEVDGTIGIVQARPPLITYLSKTTVKALKEAAVATLTAESVDNDTVTVPSLGGAVVQNTIYGTKGTYIIKRDEAEDDILTKGPKFSWKGEDKNTTVLCATPALFPSLDSIGRIRFQEVWDELNGLTEELKKVTNEISVLFPSRTDTQNRLVFNITFDEAAVLKDQATYISRPVIRRRWTSSDILIIESFLGRLKRVLDRVQIEGNVMTYKAEEISLRKLFPEVEIETGEWIQLVKGDENKVMIRADFGEKVHVYNCRGYLARSAFIFKYSMWLRAKGTEILTNKVPSTLLQCIGKGEGACSIKPPSDLGPSICSSQLDSIPTGRSDLDTCFKEVPKHFTRIFHQNCRNEEEACIVTRQENIRIHLQCGNKARKSYKAQGNACYPACEITSPRFTIPAKINDAVLPEKTRIQDVSQDDPDYGTVFQYLEARGISLGSQILSILAFCSLVVTTTTCVMSRKKGCSCMDEYCGCSWLRKCSCCCQAEKKKDSGDDESVQIVEFVPVEEGGKETFVKRDGLYFKLPSGINMRYATESRRPATNPAGLTLALEQSNPEA